MRTSYQILAGEGVGEEVIAGVELERAIGRPRMYNVISVYVLPRYQSHGLGTALMNAVCLDADEQGAELWLVPQPVGISHESLVKFYEELGFERTESTATAYMIRKPTGASS